jgi:hypothetical protein
MKQITDWFAFTASNNNSDEIHLFIKTYVFEIYFQTYKFKSPKKRSHKFYLWLSYFKKIRIN